MFFLDPLDRCQMLPGVFGEHTYNLCHAYLSGFLAGLVDDLDRVVSCLRGMHQQISDRVTVGLDACQTKLHGAFVKTQLLSPDFITGKALKMGACAGCGNGALD